MVSLELLKGCDAQNIYVQVVFKHIIGSNDNGGYDGGFCKEMVEFFQRDSPNFEGNSRSILPNSPKNLESCDVGSDLQLKIFEFINSMYLITQVWQENDSATRANIQTSHDARC